MRRRLLVLAWLCVGGMALAEAPRLERSEPANGARDVRSDVGVLRLVFDRPMKQDSWTLWASDEGELPPLEEGSKAPWRSPTVFEMRLGTMKPGTLYAIQLNSLTKWGFQGQDGAALPITVLSFTVAQGGSASPSLVGTWRFANAETELVATFAADGTFTELVKTGPSVERVKGTYKWEAGRLYVRPEDDDPMDFPVRFIGADTFELTDEDGSRLQFQRQKAAPKKVDDEEKKLDRDEKKGTPKIDPAQGTHYRDLLPDSRQVRRGGAGNILYVRQEMVPLPELGAGQAVPVGKIFLMTGDGQGQVPFIAPGKFVQAGTPWWSHDGRYIAFSCDFEMARSALFTDVFIADLEKGLVRRLTGNEWHPGPVQGYGSILGVVRQWPIEQVRGIQQVNVSHQGGNGVVHKLRGVRTNEQGKEIPGEYYYAIDHVPAGKIWVKCWISRHVGSLKIVDVLPGRETLVETMSLMEGNRLASHPSLTPDGRYCVGLSQHAYYNPMEKVKECGFDTIAVLDCENPSLPVAMWEPTKMQGQYAKQPRVSRDGRWIAFAMGDFGAESIAVCTLESMLRGSPEVRVVVPGQKVLGSHTVGGSSPDWSPDGRQLVFVRHMVSTQGFTGNLHVVNVDGSGLRQITQVAMNQCPGSPSWSPDGRRIACHLVTSRGRTLGLTDILMGNAISDIWTVGADGSDPRQLTNDGRSTDPAWGP